MKTVFLILCAWSSPFLLHAETYRGGAGSKGGMAAAEVTSDIGLEKINGFKGRFDWNGFGSFWSKDGSRSIEVRMEYSLAYKFWSLVGEPVYDMSFNHTIQEIRIISGTDDITLNRDIIPSDIFDKIYVYDFKVEFLRTSYGEGYNSDTTFYTHYPGVIIGQNKGSFDVPTSPPWDKLFRESVTDTMHPEDADFMSEAAAKSVWTQFSKARLPGGNFKRCYLRDLKVNISAAMSWLHTNDSTAYKKIVAGGKYDGMVRAFTEKIESPSLSLKEKMETADKAIEYLQSVNAPKHTYEQIRRSVQNKILSKFRPVLTKAFDKTNTSQSDDEVEVSMSVIKFYVKKYDEFLPDSIRNYIPPRYKGNIIYVSVLCELLLRTEDKFRFKAFKMIRVDSTSQYKAYERKETYSENKERCKREEKEYKAKAEKWWQHDKSLNLGAICKKKTFRTQEFTIVLPENMSPDEYEKSRELKEWMYKNIRIDTSTLPELQYHKWIVNRRLSITNKPRSKNPKDIIKKVKSPPKIEGKKIPNKKRATP